MLILQVDTNKKLIFLTKWNKLKKPLSQIISYSLWIVQLVNSVMPKPRPSRRQLMSVVSLLQKWMVIQKEVVHFQLWLQLRVLSYLWVMGSIFKIFKLLTHFHLLRDCLEKVILNNLSRKFKMQFHQQTKPNFWRRWKRANLLFVT